MKRFFLNVLGNPVNTLTLRWQSVRRKFVKDNCYCSACGHKKNLQVHHKLPRHIFPELALEFNNLITLCKDCHLHIGHRNNFKNYVENVEEICDLVYNKSVVIEAKGVA